MSDYDYDLFVIGGGSGGVRAARMSSGFGAKVAIAEEYRLGGTCVIRGCVPKKLFAYATRLGEAIEDARGFGWQVDTPSFDWPTLIANKDREIDRLNGIYGNMLERSGVETFLSRAVLTGPHTVRLESEDREVSAKYILIATGAWPFIPDIPGADLGITSNEAFHLEQLPKSISIMGGGYIAVEFACIFAGLGVETRLIYRGPQILRGFDNDIRDALAAEMRGKGVDIRINTNVSKLEKQADGLTITLDDGDTCSSDMFMFATGRAPYTDTLGLEAAGLEAGPGGAVAVNEYSQTSVEHIYAVGDVTNRVALTPVAIHEGMCFAETVFNNNPKPCDHTWISTAVFSEPEIGTVGMSEEEASNLDTDIDIYMSRFTPMVHTLSGRQTKMIMKLIVDASTDRVIGLHVLGPDAAEIVQAAGIAIKMGATKADFDATMALHPSAAEELVTMREKTRTISAA